MFSFLPRFSVFLSLFIFSIPLSPSLLYPYYVFFPSPPLYLYVPSHSLLFFSFLLSPSVLFLNPILFSPFPFLPLFPFLIFLNSSFPLYMFVYIVSLSSHFLPFFLCSLFTLLCFFNLPFLSPFVCIVIFFS